MDWCTIESDPGVFTELINNIGVQDVKVEEVYDLNGDVSDIEPIYGLIFLFRWSNKIEKRETLQIYDQDLFFANQVIQNACATQAIISVLLNAPDINIGPDLETYKEFAYALNPKDRGLYLGNVDKVRIAHNSFGRADQIVFSGSKKAKEGDDVFHFISYIPFKNNVYELDGLQDGPILLGEITNEVSWLQIAKEAIMKRVSIYQEKEVAFALLAVCKKQNTPEEQQKFEKYQEENIRRKHNYVPLIIELLKTAQRKGQLDQLIQNAKQKQQQQQTQQK